MYKMNMLTFPAVVLGATSQVGHQSEHGPSDPSFSGPLSVSVCVSFFHSFTALARPIPEGMRSVALGNLLNGKCHVGHINKNGLFLVRDSDNHKKKFKLASKSGVQ